MKRTRIFVTVPHAPRDDTCMELIPILCKLREDERYAVNIEYPCSSPSEAARSIGLKAFLESGHDHWLTIDSDNPPKCNPLDLVEHLVDKPIIGLPTLIKQHNHEGKVTVRWNAYLRRTMGYESLFRDSLDFQEVDAIGTGCLLMSGRVFDSQEMRKAPFGRVWKEDGTVQIGSDLAFCERAKHAGFSIWAHWGYVCDHMVKGSLMEWWEFQLDAWNAGHAVGYAAGHKKGLPGIQGA